jgi:hypothetical protein
VRLSPKYIFLGIVALGLPFAITVGWMLGAPPSDPNPVSAPAGAGGLGGPDGWGSAPQREGTSAQGTGYDQPARGARPAPARSAVSTAPATAAPSFAAPGPRETPPLPPLPLTDPPVPTPTMVTSEPPTPSATPSETTSPDAGGSVAERLIRRP